MIAILLFALLLMMPGTLLAQDSSDVKQAGEQRTRSTALFTAGVTTGSMGFADHRVQQGVTGVLRYHVTQDISLSASPTYARMSYPATLGGGAVSGFTDLPIEVAVDRSVGSSWSPTIGLSLGATMPLGREQIGFGSGAVGANVGLGVGVSPSDDISLHLGAGKPLTDYSAFGALGASQSTWGDAEVNVRVLEHLDATLGFNGDFAASDSAGAARAVALSLATGLGGPYTITLSGGHGVSGPAARWSLALGFGTDFAGFQSIGSSSAIQRFMRAIGGSSHRGSGSSGQGSGHGRAP